MDKQEANKRISDLLSEAEAKIKEAQTLADEYKLSFSWDLAYGMGGTYYGDPEDRYDDEDDGGWYSSSRGC